MDASNKIKISNPTVADVIELFCSKKLAEVTEMEIDGASNLVERILWAVIEGETTNLKTLIVNLGEGEVSTDVLSQAALKVENFSITGGLPSQVQAILTAVSESDDLPLTLKNLDLLGYGRVSGIPVNPRTLVNAVCRLETLTGWGVVLSYDQLQATFFRLATDGVGNSSLVVCTVPPPHLQGLDLEGYLRLTNTRVSLFNVDLSQLPLDVLTGAISRLEQLEIEEYISEYEDPMSFLTPGQLDAVLTMLATGGSKLKELQLGGINLSGVSPELLLEAIKNLEKIHIELGTLTVEQLEAILGMVIIEASHGRLQKIIIDCPDVLGTVNPVLLEVAKLVDDHLDIYLEHGGAWWSMERRITRITITCN